MNNEPETKKPAAGGDMQPVKPPLIPADYHQEDETSLYDNWRVLLQYKIHIAAITLLCTLIALAYALTASPVYQAETYLRAPNQRDIEGLNFSEKKYFPPAKKYSPELVFQIYLRNFTSRSLRREFFEQNGLLNLFVDENGTDIINANKVFENSFNQQLSYRFVDNEKKMAMTIQLQAPKAEYAAEWINKFTDFINHKTVNSIKEDIKNTIIYRIEEIKMTLHRRREVAKQKRLDTIQRISEEDRIMRVDIKNQIITLKIDIQKKFKDREEILKEAKVIAKKMNIINPFFPSVESGENTPDLIISTQEVPEYMRGVKALNAEIESVKERLDKEAFINGLRELESELGILQENPQIMALKLRENDDPFISDLPDLQNAINGLGTLEKQVEMDASIKATIVDQEAVVPEYRVEPKRKQIVFVGLLAGLILGIIIAFILSSMEKFQEQKRHHSARSL